MRDGYDSWKPSLFASRPDSWNERATWRYSCSRHCLRERRNTPNRERERLACSSLGSTKGLCRRIELARSLPGAPQPSPPRPPRGRWPACGGATGRAGVQQTRGRTLPPRSGVVKGLSTRLFGKSRTEPDVGGREGPSRRRPSRPELGRRALGARTLAPVRVARSLLFAERASRARQVRPQVTAGTSVGQSPG